MVLLKQLSENGDKGHLVSDFKMNEDLPLASKKIYKYIAHEG